VSFEEWDDPLIFGITWVDELIEVAGGEGIWPGLGMWGVVASTNLLLRRGALHGLRCCGSMWCGSRF
jgi:iron complex transport system substrate-binding protein